MFHRIGYMRHSVDGFGSAIPRVKGTGKACLTCPEAAGSVRLYIPACETKILLSEPDEVQATKL